MPDNSRRRRVRSREYFLRFSISRLSSRSFRKSLSRASRYVTEVEASAAFIMDGTFIKISKRDLCLTMSDSLSYNFQLG